MATFQEVRMAEQALRNVENLRDDMRRNASQYQLDADSGRLTVAQLASTMTADATEYQRRLAWMKEIVDTPARKTRLENGLVAWGMTWAEAVNIYQELKGAADAQVGAAKGSVAEIHAAADAMLATVAAHDSVWPV